MRRRLLGVVAAIALLPGSVLAAAPMSAASAASERPAAAPAKPSSVSIALTWQAMRSTTGARLRVSVSDSGEADAAGSSSADSLVVTVRRKGSRESHAWTFPLRQGTVGYDAGTGKGSVKVGHQIRPYGRIALTVRKSGRPTNTHCGGYKTTRQPVTVHGVVRFRTHSTGPHRWGAVGSRTSRSFSGRSVAVMTSGSIESCGSAFVERCQTNVQWSASTPASDAEEVYLDGTITGKRAVMTASRMAPLSKPRHATRLDLVTVSDNRQRFVISGGLATVKIGAAGRVAGSATLHASASSGPQSVPCGKNNSKTENVTTWQTSYKNGRKPLVVHAQVFGALRVPNATATGFQASIRKYVAS